MINKAKNKQMGKKVARKKEANIERQKMLNKRYGKLEGFVLH